MIEVKEELPPSFPESWRLWIVYVDGERDSGHTTPEDAQARKEELERKRWSPPRSI